MRLRDPECLCALVFLGSPNFDRSWRVFTSIFPGKHRMYCCLRIPEALLRQQSVKMPFCRFLRGARAFRSVLLLLLAHYNPSIRSARSSPRPRYVYRVSRAGCYAFRGIVVQDRFVLVTSRMYRFLEANSSEQFPPRLYSPPRRWFFGLLVRDEPE